MLKASSCPERATWTLASVALLGLLCFGQINSSFQDASTLDPIIPDGLDSAGAFVSHSDLADIEGLLQNRSIQNYNVDADWEIFKKSGVYVDPFDPKMRSIPLSQLEFQRLTTTNNMVLFHELVMDAIEYRDKFAANARMLAKWAPKILGAFISARRKEMALPDKIKVNPNFFHMISDFVSVMIDLSTKIKDEKGYDKQSVKSEAFRQRCDALFNWFKRVIDASPVGSYLRWDKARAYADQPKYPQYNVELKMECADLIAQTRGMGYNSVEFVLRRLINMLNIFAKGAIPDEAK